MSGPIPPEIMKKITASIKRELAMNWQSDDDIIDSFSRVAALAFLEGGAAMLPESPAASKNRTRLDAIEEAARLLDDTRSEMRAPGNLADYGRGVLKDAANAIRRLTEIK